MDIWKKYRKLLRRVQALALAYTRVSCAPRPDRVVLQDKTHVCNEFRDIYIHVHCIVIIRIYLSICILSRCDFGETTNWIDCIIHSVWFSLINSLNYFFYKQNHRVNSLYLLFSLRISFRTPIDRIDSDELFHAKVKLLHGAGTWTCPKEEDASRIKIMDICT